MEAVGSRVRVVKIYAGVLGKRGNFRVGEGTNTLLFISAILPRLGALNSAIEELDQ